MTDDGLGWAWQCNVFGHYILVRLLRPDYACLWDLILVACGIYFLHLFSVPVVGG